MRAIVCHSAKDLRLEEQEMPQMGPTQLRVQVAFGGICGSDLHYSQHGGFGTVRIKQPITLGHEVSGIIALAPLRPLPLLPEWNAQPVFVHALLRQRHALPAHSGRVQRKAGD